MNYCPSLYFLARIPLVTIVLTLSAAFCTAQKPDEPIDKKAVYNEIGDGRFMKNWLLLGPFTVGSQPEPSDSFQEHTFRENLPVALQEGKATGAIMINKQQMSWKPISFSTDIIDLDSLYKGKDYVYAYALAEIEAAAPANVLLALGSDDGIKVWHNGKLVHENWVPRGIVKDNDLVPLKLVKGSNRILLKVQDMQRGWGFMARVLDKPAMAEQLIKAAGSGIVDKINLLLDGGADVNAANKHGITPVVAARVNGRNDIVKLLLQKGAVDSQVPAPEVIVDDFYSSLLEKQDPGIAILVAKGDSVLYRKGFGYADTKLKIPATPETKFRIGSVTKQFTAAAILKLQEQGLINVTDKLSKFIPDFPRGDEVTIHHLLTHTSGIHSYTGKNDFLDRVTKSISPDSLIIYFKNDAYDFNPGQKMMYNNSGYFLLGYIIAKISGKPYGTFLKETFFDPLHMNNTGLHYKGIQLQQEAKGYTPGANGYNEALNWDMSWAGAAGALYSTVDDLLKWNRALYKGKLLSPKSLEAALTPTILTSGELPSMRYGYGLGINKYRGMDVIGHSGGLHGFITQLSYYPTDDISIVMFSNTSEPEVNFDPTKIAEAYLWKKMEKQALYVEWSETPKNLQQYTGRYELTNIGILTVTTENNQLFAQMSGQAKYPVFPLAKDEFFWKIVEAKLSFTRDDKEEINGGIIFQNGQQLKAKKLKDEKIIALDPATLDRFLGKYKLDANLIVTISKKDNRLFAKPENESILELLPVSSNDFVIKEINAKVSFIVDENGKVGKFKLNMGGTDQELLRIE